MRHCLLRINCFVLPVIPLLKVPKKHQQLAPRRCWLYSSLDFPYLITAIKDEQIFDCFPNSVLKVFITLDNEVSFTNKYSLVATINHSGGLDRGYYRAFIKDALSKQWFSCNDNVVLNVNEKTLCNSLSYALFDLKSFSISYLFIIVSCKGVLLLLALSLGVTTPLITPVTQSSGLTTLVYLNCVEKLFKGVEQPWFCLWGATTSHITPVNKYSTINCGKAEC